MPPHNSSILELAYLRVSSCFHGSALVIKSNLKMCVHLMREPGQRHEPDVSDVEILTEAGEGSVYKLRVTQTNAKKFITFEVECSHESLSTIFFIS